MNDPFQPPDDIDPIGDWLECDRCHCAVPNDEAHAFDGPQGTEWEGKILCGTCLCALELS